MNTSDFVGFATGFCVDCTNTDICLFDDESESENSEMEKEVGKNRFPLFGCTLNQTATSALDTATIRSQDVRM